MHRSQTKELLETIENQKEQITRYEVRLRVQPREKYFKVCFQEDFSKEREGAEDGQEQEEDDNAERDNEMKQQIATLSSSMATLTAEKSKMEASFQAIRRKFGLIPDEWTNYIENITACMYQLSFHHLSLSLLQQQETEEIMQRFTEEKSNLEEMVKNMESQLTDARNRLRSQQQEREQEHVNHALMLRELQTLLALERTEKDRLDDQIGELEETLALVRAEPDKSHIYEQQIKKLSVELESVQRKFIAAQEEAAKPPPLLLQLQKDMAEMKAQHRIQVEMEQQKSREADERLKRARALEEERVTALEAKLAELSEVVGSNDRVRQQDQLAIQKLKERITQLDMENTALARAANSNNTVNVEESTDPAEIKEGILKLKGLLKIAIEKSEKPVDIDDIGSWEDETSREQNPNHKACQQELRQLKDEFERYKLRAQTVIRNRNVKDTTSNKEQEELQAQMNEYKERVGILRQQLDDEEQNHRETKQAMEAQLMKQKELNKQQLGQAEGEFKQKIADLEHQVGKQRDRTMALLVDKDKEVDHLKQQVSQYTGRTYGDEGQIPRQLSSDSVFSSDTLGAEAPVTKETEQMVSQLILNPATQLVANSGTSLLHYAEEQARREVQLTTIKRQKQQLETALRQLQDKHSSSTEKHAEEMEALQEEVERWKRNRSREGTNLEYLKNVVFKLLAN
ncbi:putative GRIP and coiled-coil domain-containing protein 1-like [Apostichopus japonicus]|uniref:Putative GRIP and coiled-coil domain-containing protein 1-like n=1 Tax=Stichopus japonicus TaxID=307972 RepID=A0A2G8KKN3_STIJA|nr:putative GRIP and coiled-coil domain-containing protein 1-like [Apostichopus japonicus]